MCVPTGPSASVISRSYSKISLILFSKKKFKKMNKIKEEEEEKEGERMNEREIDFLNNVQ